MRCPPGVICIEYATSLFIISIIAIVIAYYHYHSRLVSSPSPLSPPVVITQKDVVSFPPSRYFRPPGNILQDPHVPPIQPNVYFPPSAYGMPINIRTRGCPSQYQQIGILTRINGKETVLPLLGRMLDGARSNWQYYTMSDKMNSVKLPISKNGRSCTNEYGCDNLSNGDTVYVEGYNDAFTVTLYDDYLPRYIPYV